MKVGDKVWVQQAWEDETGAYHDEVAEVVGIKDVLVEFKFDRKDVTYFLHGCEFRVEEYEDDVLKDRVYDRVQPEAAEFRGSRCSQPGHQIGG